MYRTRTCGDLRLADEGLVITLAGWVQKTRKMGGMTFVDIRDRYGITQLVFNQEVDAALCEKANKLGREYVIQVTGTVRERSSKNPNIPTGEIEIIVSELNVLNAAVTPPFTIEDDTDGGDDLRMKYRYLDLRRNAVRKNLELRHRMAFEVRNYLDKQGFLEVETPVLVNSTPEGARDFVVPSRMNPGQFYALPQSPQTLKQLLMVSGFDRYFQIVKCFRDEDLRADRQPEFTQIDCEMSFVEQEDVLNIFEGMAKHLFKVIRGIDIKEAFPRISWHDAMKYYGSDKPDLRFDMKFVELMDIMKGHGFSVFDNAAYVGGICAEGAASYTRKQLDALAERPQIVVGNKCDLATKEQIESFRSYVEGKGLTFVPISAATMQGVRELPGLVYNRLKDIPPVPVFTPEYKKPEPKANDRAYTIQRMEAHVWSIDAPWLEYILAGSNVDDYESLQYFQRQLDESGILTELVEKGVQENDTILIGEYQFDYIF